LKHFVLDNSVAIAWFFEAQATPYTEKILQRIARGDRPSVPALWISEFCNVMARAVTTQLIPRNTAREIIRHAQALPIDEHHAPDLTTLSELTLTHQLSAFDATYLELATRLNAPLATTDRALANAARSLGLLIS